MRKHSTKLQVYIQTKLKNGCFLWKNHNGVIYDFTLNLAEGLLLVTQRKWLQKPIIVKRA